MTVTVYCSSYECNEKYREAVREFARMASLNNYRVICGGSKRGLMGILIDQMNLLNANICGVIPIFMKDIEIEHKELRDIEYVDTMSQRKEVLRSGADAIIAFPGGIGTLDEFIESLVLKRLGRLGKTKLILYDIDGFWTPFVDLMNHLKSHNMVTENDIEELYIVSSPEQLKEALEDKNKRIPARGCQ